MVVVVMVLQSTLSRRQKEPPERRVSLFWLSVCVLFLNIFAPQLQLQC